MARWVAGAAPLIGLLLKFIAEYTAEYYARRHEYNEQKINQVMAILKGNSFSRIARLKDSLDELDMLCNSFFGAVMSKSDRMAMKGFQDALRMVIEREEEEFIRLSAEELAKGQIDEQILNSVREKYLPFVETF